MSGWPQATRGSRRQYDAIEVLLAWGNVDTGSVLAAVYLEEGQSFALGDASDCDAVVPSEAIGAACFVIAAWSGAPLVFAPPGARAWVDGRPEGARQLALEPDSVVEVAFGAFTLRARRVPSPRWEREAFDAAGLLREGVGAFALSAALHALCLALVALRAQALAGAGEAGFARDALATRSHLIAQSDEREPEAIRARVALGVEPSALRAALDSVRRERGATIPGVDPGAASVRPSAVEPARPSGEAALNRAVTAGPRALERTGGSLADAIQAQIAAMDPDGFGEVHGTHGRGAGLKRPDDFPSRRVPMSVIDGVVRANAGRLRVCYGVGLRRDPTLAGEVDVTFVIGPSGEVVEAHDAGGELADEAVRRCVVTTFAGLSFAPPPTGAAQRVTYPVVLSRGG